MAAKIRVVTQNAHDPDVILARPKHDVVAAMVVNSHRWAKALALSRHLRKFRQCLEDTFELFLILECLIGPESPDTCAQCREKVALGSRAQDVSAQARRRFVGRPFVSSLRASS